MSTRKQQQSSRANGAKSKGPATTAGKARSAGNAMRHGILSKTIVLVKEDPAEFQALVDQYLERFEPQDHLEHQAVEEMALLQWRLRRIRRIETELVDKHAEDWEGPDEGCVANAFEGMTSSITVLERYEARIHRMYHRAYKHFYELRAQHPLQPCAPSPTKQITSPAPGSFGKTINAPATAGKPCAADHPFSWPEPVNSLENHQAIE